MLLNLPRLKRDLLRAMRGRGQDLRAVASRQWVLCPAESSTVPPAIYPPGSVERVTSLSMWGSWASELALVRGERIEHAASVAYEVRNASVCGPVVYCGAAKNHAGHGLERWRWAEQPRAELPTASLASSAGGSRYFGMFMRADLPQALWVEDPAERLWLPTMDYSHEQGYRQLLGLESPGPVTLARVARLTIYSDFGHNASKEARFRLLRERLRCRLGRAEHRSAPRGIYLRRGSSGERRSLSNEAEVEALLADAGYRIVDPSKSSAAEVADQILDAPVVVSIEGSHLAHAIYSIADEATWVVLQPPDRFNMAYKAFADRLGMRFAFMVGYPSQSGFSVSLDELQTLLERIS